MAGKGTGGAPRGQSRRGLQGRRARSIVDSRFPWPGYGRGMVSLPSYPNPTPAMIKRILSLGCLSTLLCVATPAQMDDTEFLQDQAEKLNRYALRAFEQGFPREAKIVWLMVISDYDRNDEEARRSLGYVRVGQSWAPDIDFRYPQQDNPDARAAQRLRDRWDDLAKDLGSAHKGIAKDYEEAGRTDLSKRHYAQVIRFLPDDADAKEALEYQPIEGLSGTPLEQVLYDRSKKIIQSVEQERDKTYHVEALGIADSHAFLEKAGVEYIGVRSEHFVFRGNFDEEALKEAAMYAERAYQVCRVAFEGYGGFNSDANQWVATYAYFDDIDVYKRILAGNSDLMTREELEFRLEHSGGSTLVNGENVLVLGTAINQFALNDSAVRGVTRRYAGLISPALQEGIGHTIVGIFFQNNRHFIVDRKTQLETRATEEEIQKYSPNMDTWRDLAVEAAWEMTGTSAAELPLIHAATFPDDARIKAWSFCDYLLRRDPSLLQELDKLREATDERDVAAKFEENNDGLTIAHLELEWKNFWTGASPVLSSIKGNIPPLTAVSRDAARWLEGFNEVRKTHGRLPVSWSSSFSTRCKEHVDYLRANRGERGPGAAQTQRSGLEGASLPGSLFAQMALVSTNGRDPTRVFEKWMDWPGYRDAILNENLVGIGLYADGQLMVMDGIRGLGQSETLDFWVYPARNQSAVPAQVLVSELGPDVQKLLEENGHGGLRTLGYPISLHFGQSRGSLDSFNCTVRIRDDLVEGIVHVADGGTNRRGSAPGMVVFYPLEPLKRGSPVEVKWSFTASQSLRRVQSIFTTK